MKKIPTALFCFTSSGYPCYHGKFSTKKDAIQTAKELIDEGFAFSYKTLKIC